MFRLGSVRSANEIVMDFRGGGEREKYAIIRFRSDVCTRACEKRGRENMSR